MTKKTKTKPYGLIADLHCHNWHTFSTVGEHGVNSRLAGLMDEVERCAEEVIKVGGNLIVLAGDIFHVRGAVKTSVLNYVKDRLVKISKSLLGSTLTGGIYVVPGNHDVETKVVSRLSSAVTALEASWIRVVNESIKMPSSNIMMVPWIEDVSELKREIERLDLTSETDLILHAPIDGVFSFIPDKGLSPEYLAGLGCRNIFAGHYHHHKCFGDNVWSIGALAHHAWSDIGNKAGFLIVGDDVKWYKSHLPEFVDIPEGASEVEMLSLADGNYVRVKTSATDSKTFSKLKEKLTDMGAKAVIVQGTGKPVEERVEGVAAAARGASLEEVISEYIRTNFDSDVVLLQSLCQEILQEARG